MYTYTHIHTVISNTYGEEHSRYTGLMISALFSSSLREYACMHVRVSVCVCACMYTNMPYTGFMISAVFSSSLREYVCMCMCVYVHVRA